MQWLTNKITVWMADKFGGVTPEMRMPHDEVQAIRVRLRPMKPRLYLHAWLIAVPVGLLLAGCAVMLQRTIDGPAQNAVLDSRGRLAIFGVILVGLSASIGVMSVLEQHFASKRSGLSPEVWQRYYASTNDWLPRRMLVLCIAMSLVFVVLGLLITLMVGERVDERGIAVTKGMMPAIQPYQQVQDITLYRAFNAPIGLKGIPNLVVKFKDGTQWRFISQSDSNVTASEVADYVAARARITINHGDIRP